MSVFLSTVLVAFVLYSIFLNHTRALSLSRCLFFLSFLSTFFFYSLSLFFFLSFSLSQATNSLWAGKHFRGDSFTLSDEYFSITFNSNSNYNPKSNNGFKPIDFLNLSFIQPCFRWISLLWIKLCFLFFLPFLACVRFEFLKLYREKVSLYFSSAYFFLKSIFQCFSILTPFFSRILV